ncbi:putative phage tail protein [Bradyrhizobium sp. GM24.11]
MTETCAVNAAADGGRDGREAVAASRLARWLGLAATPTFAAMAVLTAVLGGGPADMLCSAGHGLSLGGMVPMYLLMSAFHSAAWLRLISKRRWGG